MIAPLSRCIIRPWRDGDQLSLIRHADNRNVWLNVRDNFPHPYTLADADRWIHHATNALKDLVFAIEVEGEAAGGIGLVAKEDVYRLSLEIGYWLGEQHWGKGIMTECVGAITQYAFTTFEITRLYADVFEWNTASMRVLEKNGYVKEGRMQQAIIKDGKVGDVVLYATVRSRSIHGE